MSEGPHILLLAGDVRSNRGDRAIRVALVDLLRAWRPGARTYLLSRDPEADAAEFSSTVIGRTAAGLLRRASPPRAMDFALWGGGQLLQDDSSLVKNLYWAAVLGHVRRRFGLPILGCGVGVGPLRTRVGTRLARRALGEVAAFIGRDARSCALAREIGGPGLSVREAPDPVAWLRPAPPDEARQHLAAGEQVRLEPGERLVGVALRRWFHLRGGALPHAWRRGGAEDPRFDRLLDHIAGALKAVAADGPIRYVFFPMSRADREGDVVHARRVAAALGPRAHVLRLDGDARMVKGLAGLCDVFVSIRMHPAMMAMTMGVPTLGLCHVPKVRDLFDTLGQAPSALPIEEAAGDGGAVEMERILRRLLAERETVAADLRRRLPAWLAGKDAYLRGFEAMEAAARRPPAEGRDSDARP